MSTTGVKTQYEGALTAPVDYEWAIASGHVHEWVNTVNTRWEQMRGVRFEIGIPDDPTDEDIQRVLCFLELGHYPVTLTVKMVWVDRYWDYIDGRNRS